MIDGGILKADVKGQVMDTIPGDIRDAICKKAEEERADYLVLGSRGLSGVQK